MREALKDLAWIMHSQFAD